MPEAAVEHICQMLMLAKGKHQEAITLLGKPDCHELPRLREVLKLLDEVELLADDAATYFETGMIKAAMKNLHFQHATVQAAIIRLESAEAQTPWRTPWPGITMFLLCMVIVQAMA
jgi:hypothetical protein